MFCDRCGAENSDTAKFCRKCGEPIDEFELETRVRQRTHAAEPGPYRDTAPAYVPPLARHVGPDLQHKDDARHGILDEEREVVAVRPTLKFVYAGYVLAAVGAVLLVALTSAFFFQFFSVTLSVIVGLLLFLIPAYHHLRQKLVSYRLTETKLEIDAGLIARSTRNIPLRRIQDVTVSSTAIQRLLNYGNVEIDNASEEGGKIVVRNIDSPRPFADLLLKQMGRIER